MVKLFHIILGTYLFLGGGCHAPIKNKSSLTLASCMAQMEVEMNTLFRDITKEDQIFSNIIVARRLKILQEKASNLPLQQESNAFSNASRIRYRRYRERSIIAIELTSKMLKMLEIGDIKRASELLGKLDEHRRACHVLFG